VAYLSPEAEAEPPRYATLRRALHFYLVHAPRPPSSPPSGASSSSGSPASAPPLAAGAVTSASPTPPATTADEQVASEGGTRSASGLLDDRKGEGGEAVQWGQNVNINNLTELYHCPIRSILILPSLFFLPPLLPASRRHTAPTHHNTASASSCPTCGSYCGDAVVSTRRRGPRVPQHSLQPDQLQPHRTLRGCRPTARVHPRHARQAVRQPTGMECLFLFCATICF